MSDEQKNAKGAGTINIVKVLTVRRFVCGYELRRELWESGIGDEPTEIVAAYTPRGDYIGDAKTARRLVCERGIMPEKRKPEHCCCSIGYSVKDGKWYGWSHRAIYGFKVGSTCKNGDCHYVPVEHGGRGVWVARTTADARQMAIDFAASVS